eukprot:CAMPEP_0113589626 /NCGR_PEP_ID=MMETSP0015_2-20120614/36193_1 /TAXON_ID=2838 /ORGANISM="Odontella" /LENGTH=290 /DNA_ID=CAMNT_0000495667 /DNA_START=45 /DNA_END=916 /DNA_ORIENTATION=- /assembly_acc=CAM_ASM_000160
MTDPVSQTEPSPAQPSAPYPPLPRYRPENSGAAKRPLFGGAADSRSPSIFSDVREVPDHQEVWQDCSGAADASNSGSPGKRPGGQCLIVEILSYQDEVGDAEAARFFFDDLAEANEAPAHSGGRRLACAGTAMVGAQEAADEEDGENGGNLGEVDSGSTNVDHAGSGGASRDMEHLTGENLLPNLRTRTVASLCIGYQLIAKGRDFDISGRSRSEDQEVEWVRVELCAVRLRRIMTDLLVTLSTPVGKVLPFDVPDARAKLNTEGGQLQFSEEFRGVLGSLTVDDWSLFA